MFIGLLMFGTVWFWVVLCTAWVLLTLASEFARPGWATITMVSTFALLGFLGDFNVLSVCKQSPVWAATCVLLYVLAGPLWAVAKWYFHVKDERNKLDIIKNHWFNNQRRYRDQSSDAELNAKWLEHAKEYVLPSVAKEKARIMAWMTCWPQSFVWTMINDPIKRVFRAMFEYFKGVFEGIVRSAYKDTELKS